MKQSISTNEHVGTLQEMSQNEIAVELLKYTRRSHVFYALTAILQYTVFKKILWAQNGDISYFCLPNPPSQSIDPSASEQIYSQNTDSFTSTIHIIDHVRK